MFCIYTEIWLEAKPCLFCGRNDLGNHCLAECININVYVLQASQLIVFTAPVHRENMTWSPELAKVIWAFAKDFRVISLSLLKSYDLSNLKNAKERWQHKNTSVQAVSQSNPMLLNEIFEQRVGLGLYCFIHSLLLP